MPTAEPIDRLAAPYWLGATDNQPDLAYRLADIIDGPHLQNLLADRFDLDSEEAEQAVTSISAALRHGWRATAHGEDYAIWVGRMPEVLLKCLVEMAARSANDEFATGHELRLARLMLTELAVEISSR